jgi:uroporphyrinogen decarboxylase
VEESHRHGLPYIKHTDGDVRSHLPVLVEEVGIDGFHSIEPDANMDIFELKRRYEGRLALLGNLDCNLLVHGSPAEIDAQVRRLMREVAPGGGYVFSTSNSVLMDVPQQNLEAMLEAARRYGRYPIRLP